MSPKWTGRYVLLYPHEITHRIIFNPNYGSAGTCVPGTSQVRIRSGKKGIKPQTRERILESIRQEGFRNPILVYYTPEGMFLSFGGGRLEAAKKLDTMIPAIVIDYVGDMVDHPEVTPENWQDFFTDVPQYFEWTEYGAHTHYGLEANREAEYDAAGIAWAGDEDMPAILHESPWLDNVR